MTWRERIRFLGTHPFTRNAFVAVALVLVLGFALFGYAVLKSASEIERGDERFRFSQAIRENPWDFLDAMPIRWARSALAIDDDVRFRDAMYLYRMSERRPGYPRFRADAKAALRAIGQSDLPQALRSHAKNLLGVLALYDAAADPENAQVFIGDALTAFREAVFADPQNEDAKFNLELLLRLIGSGAVSSGGSGSGAGGAGSGLPGGGY